MLTTMRHKTNRLRNGIFFLPLFLLLFTGCESAEEDMPLEPADPSGTLFIGTMDVVGAPQASLWALDAATGEVKWRKHVTGYVMTPTMANGKLFFRNTFHLDVLDTSTRELTVMANLTSAHTGSPTYYNNRVYIKDNDGEKGYNVTTGNRDVFAYTGGGDVSSAATIENGILLSTRVNFWGVNADNGNILWTNEDIVPDVNANPAVANGIAYVPAASTADFYAVDITNGEVVWDYHFTNYESMSGTYSSGSPAVRDGKVFFTSVDSMAFALNAANGNLIWKKRLNNSAWGSSPVISGSSLFVSNYSTLYSLNTNTGATRWSVPGSFPRDPVYANGCIFIASDNSIICYNASTGAEIWQKDLGVFSNNNILVVDKNKVVHHPGESGELN